MPTDQQDLYDDWLAKGSNASCTSVQRDSQTLARRLRARAAFMALPLRGHDVRRAGGGRVARGAEGAGGPCDRAIRRPEISGEFQALRLRQPGRTEGRHAGAGQSEPPHELR
ncbi:protein of unknown function [Paraburkholderia dioscoreae]|uniref:Uncharacterized protein n=1 Tax=Paraburkholderia dioscoreae TaxID=2604047 RepID=A0A5Q4ZE56_9BURK|nr:protein of unknown function [Paraburkholderia dioscoreae]